MKHNPICKSCGTALTAKKSNLDKLVGWCSNAECPDYRNVLGINEDSMPKKNYNKVLDPADFEAWGITKRKEWEVRMALDCLRDYGAVNESSEILGVGAGQEATIFHLSNDVRRVFATDLYLDAGIWKSHAPKQMMIDPSAWAGDVPHNKRRIVVQHADMLDLPYEDNTFDGVFSSGSIEHVGLFEDVQTAIKEMVRVVKPGGVISLSTEWKVSGDGHGWDPNVLLFDHETLKHYLIEPSGCTCDELIVPELDIEPASFIDIVRGRRPEIEMVLEHEGYVFTSVHIALVKPKMKLKGSSHE